MSLTKMKRELFLLRPLRPCAYLFTSPKNRLHHLLSPVIHTHTILRKVVRVPAIVIGTESMNREYQSLRMNRAPEDQKAEMIEYSRVPGVPKAEMTEYSRVPGVPISETTEYSRVPGVPTAEMT